MTALDRLVATLSENAPATLAYGVLHPPTVGCGWSGRPPAPMLRSVGAEVAVQQLVVDPVLPLGALPGTGYTSVDVDVPPGATLLLSSDGLVEGRDRSIDVGLDGLAAVLRGGPHAVEQLSEHLLA